MFECTCGDTGPVKVICESCGQIYCENCVDAYCEANVNEDGYCGGTIKPVDGSN